MPPGIHALRHHRRLAILQLADRNQATPQVQQFLVQLVCLIENLQGAACLQLPEHIKPGLLVLKLGPLGLLLVELPYMLV